MSYMADVEYRSITARQAMLDAAMSPLPERSLFTKRAIPKPGPSFGDLAKFRLDKLTVGTPPKQEFLLASLIPLGTAGLLFAPGGVGKSLLALDLCLAVAARALIPAGAWSHVAGPLGGTVPAEAAGASIFITLEDDVAEVHRRTATLDPDGRRAGTPCFVIPAASLPDFEPALVGAEGRRAALTAFAKHGLDDLIAGVTRASGFPVRLLVLDPAGAFIDADENDAQFVKPLMMQIGSVASRHRCTIMLLGHTAKAMDRADPSMRGSGAWVANSRFAYGLWRPDLDEAAKLSKKVGIPADALVWGVLTKANHRGAPTGQRRLYRRDDAGRLVDVTRLMGGEAATSSADLVGLLVTACRSAAEQGKPLTLTGPGGLFQCRADLPPELSGLSRAKLEGIGDAALDGGQLTRSGGKRGASFLTVPGMESDAADGAIPVAPAVSEVEGTMRH